VSTTMPPEVNLLEINLNGPVIAVRPYTHTDHYGQVYFETNKAIVRTCKEAGWPAPTPTQINQVYQRTWRPPGPGAFRRTTSGPACPAPRAGNAPPCRARSRRGC
jgi:hypothetical protein